MRRKEEIIRQKLKEMELEREKIFKEYMERMRQMEYEKKKESGFCHIF